jgi:segregation and condensation protein A
MQKVELPLLGPTLTFTLPHFEGPLELLLYLIQKEEVDLFEIPLKELTKQFFNELEKIGNVDLSADFLWNSSRLLLLKSRLLLPSEEKEEEGSDPLRSEILKHLIEYAGLKSLASSLMVREEIETIHFERKAVLPEKKLGTGLEEVQLETLTTIVQELIKRAERAPKTIEKLEEWEIAPKIAFLEETLPMKKRIRLDELLSIHLLKGELIVIFLAILELMKYQKIKLLREESTIWVCDATYQPI